MKDFFIMMNHPNGEIMPIVETVNEYDEKVMMFETLKDARDLADNHDMCQVHGFEIFERGDGSR